MIIVESAIVVRYHVIFDSDEVARLRSVGVLTAKCRVPAHAWYTAAELVDLCAACGWPDPSERLAILPSVTADMITVGHLALARTVPVLRPFVDAVTAILEDEDPARGRRRMLAALEALWDATSREYAKAKEYEATKINTNERHGK